MPKDYRDEFIRFLGRSGLDRQQRRLANKNRGALLDQGFEPLDSFVMLVAIETPDGLNTVFANVFSKPGKVQLLWKHVDRACTSDAVYVMGKCLEAKVTAYFPFEPCGTNGGE